MVSWKTDFLLYVTLIDNRNLQIDSYLSAAWGGGRVGPTSMYSDRAEIRVTTQNKFSTVDGVLLRQITKTCDLF